MIKYENDICDILAYREFLAKHFVSKKLSLIYFNEKKIHIYNRSFKDYYRLAKLSYISSIDIDYDCINIVIKKLSAENVSSKIISIKITQNSFITFKQDDKLEKHLLFSLFVSDLDGTLQKMYYYNDNGLNDNVLFVKNSNSNFYDFTKPNVFMKYAKKHQDTTMYSMLKSLTLLDNNILLHFICLTNFSLKTITKEISKRKLVELYETLKICIKTKVNYKLKQLERMYESNNNNIVNAYCYFIDELVNEEKNQKILSKHFQS